MHNRTRPESPGIPGGVVVQHPSSRTVRPGPSWWGPNDPPDKPGTERHDGTTLSEGGEDGPCGWLTDRFGLSGQVVPSGYAQLMGDPDPGQRDRAIRAVLGMTKLDVAAIYAAADRT